MLECLLRYIGSFLFISDLTKIMNIVLCIEFSVSTLE